MTLSIEHSLRWMRTFLAREWRLVLPVAAAFLLLPPLIASLAVPRLDAMPQTVAELQALGASLPAWLMPLFVALMLVSSLGALALNALALVGRISVGEAIVLAGRRLPVFVGASLILGTATFALMILFAALLLMGGVGQLGIGTLVLVLMLAVSLFLGLLMPLIVDRRLGPVRAITEGWRVYRPVLLAAFGAMILFLVGTWIVGLAIRVALGSVLLIAGKAAGQPDVGQTLVALVASIISALQWGTFYLLVASLYRQRLGH